MTLFVVSLFAPYTVSFCDTSTTSPDDSLTPESSFHDAEPEIEINENQEEDDPESLTLFPNELGKKVSFEDPVSYFDTKPKRRSSAHGSSKSFDMSQLLSTNPSIPTTPGATTYNETIFISGSQAHTSFNTKFPPHKHVQSASATDLTRLVSKFRNDPQPGGDWGWNKYQPTSRAKPGPGAAINRDDINLLVRGPDGAWESRDWRNKPSQQRDRSYSKDRRFRDDNHIIQPSTRGNGGLISAIDAVSGNGKLREKYWVGTLGMPTDALELSVKLSISEKMENEYETLVVFVEDTDFEAHYERYCKTVLWPILHYHVPDHPKSKAYLDHSWQYYKNLNRSFADQIFEKYQEGDVIWIQDYHLLLLPNMIRTRFPNADIAFHMHSAFPSSEIFKCLANREELLEGMLGANLISFQTKEYAHHFLQTCGRLLKNAEATDQGITLEDLRYIHVDSFPMGIDVKSLDKCRLTDEVEVWIRDIRKRYKGKRIVVARDKLDNIRGVKPKMLAYEKFLLNYPRYRRDVVLIQIATSGLVDPDLLHDVAAIATRINNKYSTLAHQPLVFLQQDIVYSQFLALLSIAECLMITSHREGFNLTPYEFALCQDGTQNNQKHGPVILSEFTGAAKILDDCCLLVNPWDVTATAATLKKALDMRPAEKETMWSRLHQKVHEHDAESWYESFSNSLKIAKAQNTVREATSIPRLSLPILRDEYGKSNLRLLILDFEGTLVTWGSPAERVLQTPERALKIIKELVYDSNNIVYIMSQRALEDLEIAFLDIPEAGLIAENGSFFKKAGEDEWTPMCPEYSCNTDEDSLTMPEVGETSATWKKDVQNIFHHYKKRMSPCKVEVMRTQMIFDYRKCGDQEFASMAANDFINSVNEQLGAKTPGIIATHIEKGVFVSLKHINKSTALARIFNDLHRPGEQCTPTLVDFLLVVGDGKEDEDVFKWANEMKEDAIEKVVTVKVGQKSSTASALIPQGIKGVLGALEKMSDNNW